MSGETGRAAGPPLVSVVMTTWNGERHLREAIDSALAQDYAPVELVVVDDGSTDGTAAICRSYGDRIRYVRQPKDDKRGATAVVRAYAEARGAYLAPLDHDDVWLPGKITRQVAALRAEPEAGAVFTRVRLIDDDGADQGIWELGGRSGDVFHMLLEGNRYCYSSGMFTRRALDAVGHHDVDAGIGDWDLWLRIARRFAFIMLDDVLTAYRVHGGGYSTDSVRMFDASERVLANQVPRLHPGCPACRRSLRTSRDKLANAWLELARERLEAGARRGAITAIRRAWRLSPRGVLYWGRRKPRDLIRSLRDGLNRRSSPAARR